jgi:hypothetical protein
MDTWKKINSFPLSSNFNLHRPFDVTFKDIAVRNFNNTLKHLTTVQKRNPVCDVTTAQMAVNKYKM